MAILSEDDFKTVSIFKGYINKPDITNIAPTFLVKGSKNMMIDYANRVVSRLGYTLFGAANNGGGGIVSSYEWATSTGKEFPLRSYDGRLEFYWNGAWNLLKSGYAASQFAFAKVWDNTEKIDVLMFVMGDANQYKWSGGATKVASSTSTTLTKQGVLTAKTTIAFVAGTPGSVAPTITDSNNGFLTAGFAPGDTLYVTGSTANSRNFTIGSVTAGVITLIMGNTLTSEAAGSAITIHNGEPTWAVNGAFGSRFLFNDANRKIIYNGVEYTYTGGAGTDTLTGLTSFPTVAVGEPVWQSIIVVPNNVAIGTTQKAAPTITIASPAVITSVGHGLVLNDTVFFLGDVTGTPAVTAALPTGITASTIYYVISDGLGTDTFEISATQGGSAINTSGSQSGTFSLSKAVPASFTPDLIGVQLNQLILASKKSREIYISDTTDYTKFMLQSPRAPGSPAKVTMDDYATCIEPMDNIAQTTSSLIFGAGRNAFFQLSYQLAQDNSSELVRMIKFKTASGSGLIAEGAITPIKNSTAYISREPALDTLANIQNTDVKDLPLSDIIKNDFDAYNFTNAHVVYWKRAIYIALPAQGLVLIYDLMRNLWQPPQTMPISRLAIISDQLYGHSSITNETYQLFTGTSDNGNYINQVARFAYNNGGARNLIKTMTEQWSDGYISPSGTLNINLYFGFNGADGKKTFPIMGNDSKIADLPPSSPLGSEPMGSLQGLPLDNTGLAGMVRFWQLDTMPQVDFTEMFVEYTMTTLNAGFALVAYGSNMVNAETSPTSHKK